MALSNLLNIMSVWNFHKASSTELTRYLLSMPYPTGPMGLPAIVVTAGLAGPMMNDTVI